MNKRARYAAFVALALGSLVWGCGKSHVEEGTVISVIYSTDTRGKLEGCGCKKNGGGISRRAAKLEGARRADETVLYLDAGNCLSGSAQADASKGEIMVAALNELKATAVNVSERELAYGMAAFRKAVTDSKFPYVSANVLHEGRPVAEPVITKSIHGANVAIVGLCGTKEIMRSDSALLPDKITIRDPLRTARDVIPPLTGKADLIIVLSTCGDAIDSILARDFQMVNLIIGGRSFRPNTSNPWVLGQPRVVRAERDGKELGRMDLVFGSERKIKTYSARTLGIEVADPASQSMLAVVREYIPDFADTPTGAGANGGGAAGTRQKALTP